MDALTFQTEVRRIEKLMYRVGMSYLGNNDDVADAVQDTLAKAWEKRNHLKKLEQFKPWMMRILTNRCIDMLRKRKRISFFPLKDTLDRVVTFTPEQETVTPDVTLKVKEAAFTPLMTYITLEMQPNAESVAAYKAEHGEGFYGEDGSLLWEYTGADIYGGWVSSLQLVDGNGTVLFPDHWGNNGYSTDWAEFTYPYMDAQNQPEELWLAPVEDGAADMTRAVRIK